MAMDGLSLRAMVRELQCLQGAKIDKVQQPDRDTVLLLCHGALCGRVRLLLNIHNENGRIQLTEQTADNPAAAPAFCMLLRKYLIGSRLTAVEQVGLDRIVKLSFSGRDELFDETAVSLLLELMGKHGNLFLLDKDGIILDCLRHIGLSAEALRVCLPNVPYEAPPGQAKLDPYEATVEALEKADSPKQLLNSYFGLSKQTAALLFTPEASPRERALQQYAVFSSLKEGTARPCLLPAAGPLPFTPPLQAEARPFPTLSAAFDSYYRERDVRLRMGRETAQIRSLLEHGKSRCENKLTAFQKDLGNGAEEALYRQYGQLLTSCRAKVPKGALSVLAEDYSVYPPALREVPLQADLSLSQNAARYFKKYQKCKAARAYAEKETSVLEQELTYLEGELLSLDNCENSQETAEIKEELRAQGYIRSAEAKSAKKQKAPSKPLSFLSGAGVPILVGKNNTQNDALTKNAPPDALWLHVKDMAGSHVLVESKGIPDPETLKEAAMLAAYYSKGRASGQVPVDYVLRKYVKKPAGSKPGFVIFTNQRTLFVTPDKDLADKLRRE